MNKHRYQAKAEQFSDLSDVADFLEEIYNEHGEENIVELKILFDVEAMYEYKVFAIIRDRASANATID